MPETRMPPDALLHYAALRMPSRASPASTQAPTRPRDLGKHLLVARYNLSRLLDRLEAEGLIEREDCPDDARGQVLKLTRAGKALRTRMGPFMHPQ
jgi:DNA-binding MarR family transcriptional regulator